MMANLGSTSPVIYHTSSEQKRKSKNAAKEFKFGSPKLRDLLREKCRIRMKDARQQSFGKGRFVNTETINRKTLITTILRQELANLEDDINLQEFIFKELTDEENNYFLEELENDINYLIQFSETNSVFCPVCQKFDLQQGIGNLYCDCSVSFNFTGSVHDFNEKIQDAIKQHETNCENSLSFFIEPNTINENKIGNLIIFCDTCDSLYTVHK